MSGRIGRHVRSNVVGYVALFIALGGVTYAAGLAKDSVKSKQIKTGAVRSEEAKDASLTGADIADESLTGADVNEGTLSLPTETAEQLLDKLKTVDGAGSSLSADSLDDLDSSNLYTKLESDGRYPLADVAFSNLTASTSGTYIPFADFAQLDLVCDAGGNPTLSLKNVSGSNLRVYTDTGVDVPVVNAPLGNGASTTSAGSAVADNTADRITYLVRGGVGTVRIEAWIENLGAPNITNCLFNTQALGQGALTPAS